MLIFYTTSAQLVSYPQDTRCPTPPLETRMDTGFQISLSRSETFRASLSRRELFKQDIFRLPRFTGHKENSTTVRSSQLSDAQTFGGLRTSPCGRTPTGAGPTASPRQAGASGTWSPWNARRNPAPSRDAAACSTLVREQSKTCFPVRWYGQAGG